MIKSYVRSQFPSSFGEREEELARDLMLASNGNMLWVVMWLEDAKERLEKDPDFDLLTLGMPATLELLYDAAFGGEALLALEPLLGMIFVSFEAVPVVMLDELVKDDEDNEALEMHWRVTCGE